MPEGQQPDAFTKIVLGVLSSLLVVCVLGGVNMYANQQVMQQKLDALVSDQHRDDKQDKTDSKHWRYLTYLKTEVDALRHAQGLPPAPSPDLGD